MEKTPKAHLIDTFEDLDKNELKRFKRTLCDRKQEPRVRKALIEKVEDSLDLADLMITKFTSNGAVGVTIEILETIECNEQANDLKEKTKPSLPVTQPDDIDSAQRELTTDDYLSDECPKDFTPCSQAFKDKLLKERGTEIYEPLDKSKRKRLALLITNINFDSKSMIRRGAEKDEENMECLLRQMDYDVVKHRDLSGNEMDDAVKSFAKRKEHERSDSTFVVIMSHGMLGAILGIHYNEKTNDVLPIDNIYNHLNSANCKALVNKPKVILIQACRGGEHGRAWVPAAEKPVGIEADDFVHKEKDFISLLSCTPETKSYRHVEFGTFYVWCMLKVFRKVAHGDHIEEMFRKIMRCFENDKEMIGAYKQMVCKDRATLTKLFYLFPGL